VQLVGFITRIYHDARSPERQMESELTLFLCSKTCCFLHVNYFASFYNLASQAGRHKLQAVNTHTFNGNYPVLCRTPNRQLFIPMPICAVIMTVNMVSSYGSLGSVSGQLTWYCICLKRHWNRFSPSTLFVSCQYQFTAVFSSFTHPQPTSYNLTNSQLRLIKYKKYGNTGVKFLGATLTQLTVFFLFQASINS